MYTFFFFSEFSLVEVLPWVVIYMMAFVGFLMITRTFGEVEVYVAMHRLLYAG